MSRLKDKVAVVTGAGAGIGRAIATVFAEEGAHVYVTDVNGESAAAAAGDLAAWRHTEAVLAAGDLLACLGAAYGWLSPR